MNILKLANNAVMKINWTKYYDTKMTSTNNILLLPAVIILTAIFITYFCENILLNFRKVSIRRILVFCFFPYFIYFTKYSNILLNPNHF